MKDIQISPEFKSQAVRAILSIVVFVLTYIILLVASVAITIFSLYAAYTIVTNAPGLITGVVGIGLASFGIIIFSFLIKFLFKSHKVDRSHLKEITKDGQPELFALIKEVVDRVDTDFPKKVYLSSEVNASVFYNSSFLSMFFPVRKNLMIGLGLINTITKEELKAILAHEFGHFSQRSMKVGSYVYYVNQVIFNLLYENDDYDNTLKKWGDVSSYIAIFALIALEIVKGIQWILAQMYNLVNKRHLALSREMEFHADLIAANVTGYQPLVSSLLRMQLSDYSLNAVFEYYGERIAENKKSNNVFLEQLFVMDLFAKNSNLSYSNSLPQVSFNDLNKFNKSKLIIKNQWASHPSTEERIDKLKHEAKRVSDQETIPANALIKNLNEIQKELTNNSFISVEYQGEIKNLPFEDFSKDFEKQLEKNTFSKFYNGYYDDKSPIELDFEKINDQQVEESIEDLFSNQKVDLVYQTTALESDIETISLIKDKKIPIKSFDYDGKKYKRKHSSQLISNLTKELEVFNEQIKQNDVRIYTYFAKKEKLGPEYIRGKLQRLYEDFFNFNKVYEEKVEIYNSLSNELHFIHLKTDYDTIRSNFKKIKTLEFKFKKELQSLLENEKYKDEITVQIRENIDKYLAEELQYFGKTMYFDNNLTILFTALYDYLHLLGRGYFITKKELLLYQENVFKESLENA